MGQRIKIACEAADAIDHRQLSDFQGDLKTITKANLDKLKNAIIMHGFTAPVFVWKNQDQNFILDGHQRIKAISSLREEGYTIPKLPVAYIKAKTEKEAREKLLYITSQYGDMNKKGLEAYLLTGDLHLADLTIRLVTGDFSLNKMTTDGKTRGDDELPIDVEEIAEEGDLWQLGQHRLLCADATTTEAMKALMGQDMAQMVFTDPPYGVSYEGSQNRKGREWDMIANDDLRDSDLKRFLTDAFKNAETALVENGSVYVFFASSNHIEFETAMVDAGLQVKQQLIWAKGMILSRSDYHWNYEPFLYGCRRGQNPTWYGDRAQKCLIEDKINPADMKKVDLIKMVQALQEETTVWDISKDRGADYIHPTQKPIALALRAMRNSTVPNQIVLDQFAGSGSTIIAAQKAQRRCYAMEMDTKMVNRIIARYKKWMTDNGMKPKVDVIRNAVEGKRKKRSAITADNKKAAS